MYQNGYMVLDSEKKLAYPVFGVIAQEVWNGCAPEGQRAHSPGQSVATPWVLMRMETCDGVAELVEDVFKWSNLSPLLRKEGLGVVGQ